MTDRLHIIKPDDWHIHLRDGEYLKTTVPHCANQFHRAIVMPNLESPIYTVSDAESYRQRILKNRPEGSRFTPLMTLYLTEQTSIEQIQLAKQNSFVHAVKLYPSGATTGSAFGVTDITKTYPILAAMEECGLPLLIHGEVVDDKVDIYDKEKVFIDRTLSKIVEKFTQLPIVLEHITTKEAVNFVSEGPQNLAATITAHHLLINRSDMFNKGIRPHLYCLPIAKREVHRKALLDAATSGNQKFFLGTDSAPHGRHKKESSCGCAGIYTAYSAIELYATAFAQVDKLSMLEGFSSIFGAKFYGLPVNVDTITLEQKVNPIPSSFPFAEHQLIPFMATESLDWKVI